MTDRISKARRSWNMSRIKGKDTGPERTLRSHLHQAGYRFRLHQKTLPGRPDIVLARHRAAIFVHGCFWHRHTGCHNTTTPKTNAEFWQDKFRGTVARDVRNKAALTALGWQVIVVWECELERDARAVMARITPMLQEGRHG